MTEDINNLRERVAVAEATLRSHQDLLKEVRDAVLGINTSLHILTRLEERVIKHQEADEDLKQRLQYEREERSQQAQAFGERIGNLEILLGEVNNQTTLNSHGRNLMERLLTPTGAAIASGLIVALVSWLVFTQPLSS